MFVYIIERRRPSKTIANITQFLTFISLIIKETRGAHRNFQCLIIIFCILFIICRTEIESKTNVG